MLGDTARAFDHCIKIIRQIIRAEPEFLGAVHQVKHLRRPQQCLGRDTAPVQANSAHVLALDNRDLEAELRTPNGRHIAPGACTDHNHIKTIGHDALRDSI